jgi:PhnB protein
MPYMELEFPVPEEMKKRILQATMEFGSISIRLSDSFSPVNAIPTDLISIVLEADVDQVKRAFEVLQAEGNIIQPLQETFFSPCYGTIVDKFGVKWQLAAI